ncbi:MAG TPA: hypothetical protein DD640_05860 [Clostridiales bacterium]|nr:hypothetical protein [Clostridiales bacterium]
MQKKKLFLLISIVVVLLVGVASVSYAAATYNSPAEIIAGLTGKSVDDVVAARQAGTSYGAQALDAGQLAQFQAAKLELYKQRLDQAVADEKMTQEEADKLYEAMELRLQDCTGDGTCQGSGFGAGQNNRMGAGKGGFGMGRRAGNGSGSGLGCANGTNTPGN